MSEMKVDYSAQPYAIEKYNVAPVITVTYEKELELPCYSICFARKIFKDEQDEGIFSSFWKEDENKKEISLDDRLLLSPELALFESDPLP